MINLEEKDGMNFVEYKTVAGQSFPIGSLGKGDLRFRIQNTLEEECRNYAKALCKAGYKEEESREIPAGSEYPYNTNLFYAYKGDKSRVFIFWDASIHTTFITYEPYTSLPKASSLCSDKQIVSPSFTQLELHWGMCYIVRLPSGEFIIVDGGKIFDKDVERLYNFLKDNSPLSKPVVATWFFTHPHKDHIGNATCFIEKYKGEIEIRSFAYQFPDCDKITVYMESVEETKERIENLEKSIKEGYPDAVKYPLHTGQRYSFPGVDIDVLWSLDDTYPSYYTSFNETSAALRLTFKSGKKVLLLADCQHEANRKIAHRYGDYLKSDIMQVAHHGLIGGDKGLYKLVDPEICFWPTTEAAFSGNKPGHSYQWSLGDGGCDYNAFLRDNSVRERVHYHAGKTVTIEV